MGRAMVREPAAFLMDEPLSNLDAKLRVQMRAEIASLQRQLGVTTIYVTHDQTEALTMGDRVAVLKDGVLQQIDTPKTLYHQPINVFVAGFIGSPAMNLFEGRLVDGRIVLPGTSIAVPASAFERSPRLTDVRRRSGDLRHSPRGPVRQQARVRGHASRRFRQRFGRSRSWGRN